MDYKNTNSAVIKQWFVSAKKADLINEAIKLKLLIIATPVEDNKNGFRNKLLTCFRFARVTYKDKYLIRR